LFELPLIWPEQRAFSERMFLAHTVIRFASRSTHVSTNRRRPPSPERARRRFNGSHDRRRFSRRQSRLGRFTLDGSNAG
jgi:hypothetical protein